MHQFKVLKKERDYFLAQKGIFHCKIIIDDFSMNLPIGTVNLHVEEVSDKYKHHSNEAIFKLIVPWDDQTSGICTLSTGRRNLFVYKHCLRLGGKWESIINQWVFSSSISQKVDVLEDILNSEEIYIEAKLKETVSIFNDEFTLFGYPIIQSSENGKVILCRNVKRMSGDIAVIPPKKTIILAGSKFRLFIQKAMLNDSSFHEDFMCIVDIKKKRKPKPKIINNSPSPWEM